MKGKKIVITMVLVILAIVAISFVGNKVQAAIYENFEYTVYGDNIIISGFTEGTNGEITVPNTINGKTVTEISVDDIEYNKKTYEVEGDWVTEYVGQIDHNYKVTKIVIPKFAEKVTINLKNLESIEVEEGNSCFISENGILYKVIGKRKFLNTYPAGRKDNEYTVPEDVYGIRSCGIRCENLKEIIIPDSLKFINLESMIISRKRTRLSLGTRDFLER